MATATFNGLVQAVYGAESVIEGVFLDFIRHASALNALVKT